MQHWMYGLLNLPWWGYIVMALVLTHLTIIGVTLFLHRSQSHRACDFHPVIFHFLRFWLWLTTGMITKEFVSIHRKHHATCETEDDPHSPIVLGINTVLWEGVECYRVASRISGITERYGHGTPDDWIERNLYTRFNKMGILVMFILDLLFMGAPGIVVWAVQMSWIPFTATGVINGIGHYWGYRNYECPDASTNISPWGILIGGEELHNNHHAFGTSAKLSVKWYEFDIGWMYLKILKTFGLAKINRLPPTPHFNASKQEVDVDTVQAAFTNRFQLMSNYCQKVVKPVFDEETRKAQGQSHAWIFDNAKKLFVQDDFLTDVAGKEHMEKVMESSPNLKTVHDLKNSLMAIWAKTTASKEELVAALKDWCSQAQASDIKALQKFVDHMKTYTMAAA